MGSGPGDPQLLTLRGMKCLARADVVLYDYLCNSQLLRFVRPGATIHCLGSHAERKLWNQQQINNEMVAQAQAGKCVVRLKSGDPTVFARAPDEIAALHKHKIPFEIVPGVTSALAASAYTGIPVTHSQHASAVAFVTGHEKEGKPSSAIDYRALATFPGTLVFYMGVTTAPQWTRQLIEHGRSPSTPAAIIRRCSWPDQQTFRCTLEEIPQHLHSGSQIRPPVIVVVGDVAADRTMPSWFENRPLFGQSILVTRPEHQAEALRDPLVDLGAEVLVQPAIEIGPPADPAPLDAALENLEQFDWIAFSSRNGVRYFLERLFQQGHDLRKLGHLQIAAIGPGTDQELAQYHLRADVLPQQYRAESLVEVLASEAPGKHFLLPRASRGRDVLPQGLTNAGGQVTEVIAYESTDIPRVTLEIERHLQSRGGFDWVILTSSAIAKATAKLLPEVLAEARLVSISPITSETVRQLGYEVEVEAVDYTMEGILEALLDHRRANK